LPHQAAAKVKRIEELLNGRRRSDVHLAVSPYTNPIKADESRCGGRGDRPVVGLLGTEREMAARLERMARKFVEPAATL
jgi:hypothetical protein